MCQGCWSTSQTRPQKIHRSKSFCHYERKVKFWFGQFSGKSRSWGPGGMGLPTRSSPEQMPRPYEVAKFSLFQFFTGLKKTGAVGENSTTRTQQNSWAEKTRLSRHSSFLVLAPLGSTGHHLCYHLVLRIFHEKKKNTRYLDFFKAREKLWFCWHWSGQPEYWTWTNSGVNFSQKWNEIQRIWNRFF